jgi:hypothetical protein
MIEEWDWPQIFDISIPKKKQPLESGRDGCIGLGEIITRRRRFYFFGKPIIRGNMKRLCERTVYLPTLIKVRDAYIKKMGKEPINLRENF